MLTGFRLSRFRVRSAVWCSAADTHLILQDCAVSGAGFLTLDVFDCIFELRKSSCVIENL